MKFSRIVLVWATVLGLASVATAASSISNSLTGFTGNSTQAGTQAAVAAAGFSFYSITGLNDPDFTEDPTVTFDSGGAHFGTLWGGDGGRNYMRTIESDYATVSFVAEVTFITDNLPAQDGFMGMGAGDTALFGWPDWSTQFSSVMLTPEVTDAGNPLLTTMHTTNDTPVFANTAAPNLGSGANRIRMAYDAVAKTVNYSMDYNYSGGAFVEDQAAPTLNVGNLIADPIPYDAAAYTVWRDTLGSTTDLRANFTNSDGLTTVNQLDYDFWKANFGGVQSPGWPVEPSRIFFGGDDSTIFKDFSVVVSSGSGGLAVAAGVPEPSSLLLIVWALTCLFAQRKRGSRS